MEKALTFDDVLLVPAYSNVLPRQTILKTKLSKRIQLNIPMVSAAMDTVTEARLAIALAQEGGIGIIHKNFSIEEQAAQVRQVKRFEAGIVRDPITVRPDMRLVEVIQLQKQHGISGFPVVQGKRVVGIITNRDVRFAKDLENTVAEKMTPGNRLVTLHESADIEDAKRLMNEHRLERILLVDEHFELRGLLTAKDVLKSTEHPLASKDSQGRLRVGAAVGTQPETDERVERLVQAGVDVLIVDTAHGHSQGVLDRVQWIKKSYPHIDVIGGNIATQEAAKALIKYGADGVKVGIGPGSICTTRIIAGVGVPQITAIQEVSRAVKGSDVTVIADGGIRYSGDIAKALAAGAHSVMMGGVFAGTEEAPGEVILYKGRSYKSYRGMGSVAAMRSGSADRYFQDNTHVPGETIEKLVPEGVEGQVPYKGSVLAIIHQLVGGVRSAMGYCGCASIDELRERAQFVQISTAGVRESHVHDVRITKESPNYRLDLDD